MAIKNSINSGDPVEVSKGGTGTSTLTDHGVLVGSGTSAVTPLSVGTTGQLLVGATGADPAFGASAGADFTFTSSTASTTRTLTVSNTDNTAAATSAANAQITVGGANVGDPQVTYTVTGVNSFSSGIDNSDSDKYKISQGTALGTNDVMSIDTTGNVNKPLTSAFNVYSSYRSNFTGDGTVFTYTWDTERFDQNSNYNTGTYLFTAPSSGKYLFGCSLLLKSITADDYCKISLVTSDRTYTIYTGDVSAFNNAGYASPAFSIIVEMDASDTAYTTIETGGSTKTTDSSGAAPGYCGSLLA